MAVAGGRTEAGSEGVDDGGAATPLGAGIGAGAVERVVGSMTHGGGACHDRSATSASDSAGG